MAVISVMSSSVSYLMPIKSTFCFCSPEVLVFAYWCLSTLFLTVLVYLYLYSLSVPAGSRSRGGAVAQPSLPTPFYSVLVSFSVFMALSTVFRSINSPDNSLLSHSELPVLFLPYWLM